MRLTSDASLIKESTLVFSDDRPRGFRCGAPPVGEGLHDIREFVRVGDSATRFGVGPIGFEQYSLFRDGSKQ